MLTLLLCAALAHVPHDEIMALASSPDGHVVFAYCEVRGLYRSVDGGFNWETLLAGLPDCGQGDMEDACEHLPYDSRQMALALSPSFKADATVFFAFAGGLYKSVDAGLSWHKLLYTTIADGPASGISVTRDPGRGDPIHGAFGVGGAVLALSDNYARDRTMLAIKGSGLLRSTDCGESFQASAVPSELRAVVATPGGGFVALTLAGALLSSPQVR
jgi:hypothetical protein